MNNEILKDINGNKITCSCGKELTLNNSNTLSNGEMVCDNCKQIFQNLLERK